MLSRLMLNYVDGHISSVTMYAPVHVELVDCRSPSDGGEAFVTLAVRDSMATIDAYLSPELAEELTRKLMELQGWKIEKPPVVAEILARLTPERAEELGHTLVEMFGWKLAEPPAASTAAEPATE